MTVGDRIRKKRTDLGISQKELADKLKTTKQTIYKYEMNIITNIPSDKLEEMAKIFEISPCYLMGWEEKESAKKESPKIMQYYELLNDIGKHEATKRVEEMTHAPQYAKGEILKAAHAIEGASEEDRQFDTDIMENF